MSETEVRMIEKKFTVDHSLSFELQSATALRLPEGQTNVRIFTSNVRIHCGPSSTRICVRIPASNVRNRGSRFSDMTLWNFWIGLSPSSSALSPSLAIFAAHTDPLRAGRNHGGLLEGASSSRRPGRRGALTHHCLSLCRLSAASRSALHHHRTFLRMLPQSSSELLPCSGRARSMHSALIH